MKVFTFFPAEASLVTRVNIVEAIELQVNNKVQSFVVINVFQECVCGNRLLKTHHRVYFLNMKLNYKCRVIILVQ